MTDPTLLEVCRYVRHMPRHLVTLRARLAFDETRKGLSPYDMGEVTCISCEGSGNIGYHFCPMCKGFGSVSKHVVDDFFNWHTLRTAR